MESLTAHATEHATEHTVPLQSATTPPKIWEAVDSRFILHSRGRRERSFEIRVAVFHEALGLMDKHAQVIRALRNESYHDKYAVRLKRETEGQPKIFEFEVINEGR